MSADATRPKGPVPATPVAAPEKAADPEVKVEAKGDAKVEAKDAGEAKKPETPSPDRDTYVSSYASSWSDPDKYHGEFFIGGSWMDFANGKSMFDDHSGLSLGVDARIKFPFAGDAFYGSAGARYQYDSPSFDLQPGTSDLKIHSIGLVGGIHWRAVPEWLTIGAEAFLGPSFMSSSCNMDSEGFCDGESGTVYNLNAQAYPVDTTGFNTGLGLRVGVWRDIINIRPGFNKIWGSSGDIETATQGSFSQPFSPGGFSFQVGVNLLPLFSGKTWNGSTYSGEVKMNHLDKTDGTDGAKGDKTDGKTPKGPKADGAKTDGAKTPTTPTDFAKQFTGQKANVAAARDRVKAIAETDLPDTAKAAASVFGGEDKKQAKMKALVEEAKSKGSFAEYEYLGAKKLLVQWEGAVEKMEAGEAKTKAQAELDKAKSEFKAKKGGDESIMELNHDAYKYAKKAVDEYNRYAARTKGVDKTDFDLVEPECYKGNKKWTPPPGWKPPANPQPTGKPDPQPDKPKPDPQPDKPKPDGGKVPALDF